MGAKALVWLHGKVKSPPLSREARLHAGYLLREIQEGVKLPMPDSRPMPSIAPRVHELRVDDPKMRLSWRKVYRIDSDAIVIADVFAKKTKTTSLSVISTCRKRFMAYDRVKMGTFAS